MQSEVNVNLWVVTTRELWCSGGDSVNREMRRRRQYLIDEGGLRPGVRRRRRVVLRLPRRRGRRRLTRVRRDAVVAHRQDPLQEVLPDHLAGRAA